MVILIQRKGKVERVDIGWGWCGQKGLVYPAFLRALRRVPQPSLMLFLEAWSSTECSVGSILLDFKHPECKN